MNREAVQHERGPRTATLRKQMEMMESDKASYIHHPLRHQSPVSYPSLTSLAQMPLTPPPSVLTAHGSSRVSEASTAASTGQLFFGGSYLSRLLMTQQQLLLRQDQQMAADLEQKHDLLAQDQMQELDVVLKRLQAMTSALLLSSS